MKKLAIFASGSGSNAENLIRFFQNHPYVRISLVYSNKADAFVLERIKPYQIPGRVMDKNALLDGSLLKELDKEGINMIVLAGFLKLVPFAFIQSFKGPIINLHPSLLPAYGGKGMHGMHVHEAVIAAKEKQSGITIHHVNDQYDQGAIIKQYTTDVAHDDTPSSLASKIHDLEMTYLPVVVEQVALQL
ncbi:MAG: phosphoribosylglycinamide formyltransferase [Bacteroidota bacterium]|jgi:phosphoribosylglycinamide formyltransferase-1